MATYEIIISGFGGQGIQAAGKLLAYAGMLEGKYVSCLPSYGPEKRGGASNAHIVISNEPVGSPFINEPSIVIAMSNPAFDKYEKLIVSNGLLIFDNHVVTRESFRKDIEIIGVPATRIALELGQPKMANMVLIGKLLNKIKVLSQDYIIKAMYEVLPENKHYLIPDEIKMMQMGMNYGS